MLQSFYIVSGDLITQFTLNWNKTCYNGKYTIWLMNEANTWKIIGSILSNDQAALELPCSLPVFGEIGKKIIYKVMVSKENSSKLATRESNVTAFNG